MELHCHHWGFSQSKKSRLLLLHGLAGNGHLWRSTALFLENDYEILAPDQRGHGESAKTPDREYSPITLATDVAETLDKRAFHPTWVVGHSLGARTGAALAHLRPEWVQGLVLIDLGLGPLERRGFPEALRQLLEDLPREFESREALKAYLAANSPDVTVSQYLLAVARKHPSGPLLFPFDHSALLGILAASEGVAVRDWVREAAERGIPVLALRGERSTVWTREAFDQERQRFADLQSVRWVEVPDAGHGLPFENRGAFLRELRAFMNVKILTKPPTPSFSS